MLDYRYFKEIHELFLQGHPEEARRLLVDMQARYISVCDENTRLKTYVNELEEVVFLAENLFFDGSCYWLNSTHCKQGPFCQHCYQTEGILIRLKHHDDHWICPSCNSPHTASEHKQRYIPLMQRAPQAAQVIPFAESKKALHTFS